MMVIFYKQVSSEVEQRINSEVESKISMDIKVSINSMEELIHCLSEPESFNSILVLFLGTAASLFSILAIRERLLDHRIILILPNRDQKIISKGHKLHPRFLTYMDNDLKNVYQVLDKMLLSSGDV